MTDQVTRADFDALAHRFDELSHTVTRAIAQIEERDHHRGDSCPHMATIVRASNNVQAIRDIAAKVDSLERDKAEREKVEAIERDQMDIKVKMAGIGAISGFLSGGAAQILMAFVMGKLGL